jgi:UDP-N-acetylmuramoylalanine--D-glutamate ligase
MIAVFPFDGIKTAVLGLGKSGLVAAKALMEGGAEVMAWDDDARKRAAAAAEDVPIVDLATAPLDEVPSLVLSPGIPHTWPKPHPIVARAKAAGLEIIGDIELLARTQREARWVGITGTNGKSTTTALLGHVLSVTGRDVAVGGNLGTPALSLEAIGQDALYVLEMSSYQLELTVSITWDVAILLNVTPDHLDRHGGMEGYIAAKKRIFDRQTRPRAAIIGVDDPICRALCAELQRAGDQVVIPISAEGPVPGGVWAEGGYLVDNGAPILELARAERLPGKHNWQNIAAVWAAAKHLGVQPHQILATILTFPGLAHRQELVDTIGGVKWVNDSKATNADATEKALACYDDIWWIAGGLPKEGGIASLAPYFPRIRHAFLIGKAAEEFARTLEGKVPYTMSGTLANAVAAAREAVQPGGVVLLSPSCASFDQFANFEARGDAFRELVRSSPQGEAREGTASRVQQSPPHLSRTENRQ